MVKDFKFGPDVLKVCVGYDKQNLKWKNLATATDVLLFKERKINESIGTTKAKIYVINGIPHSRQ